MRLRRPWRARMGALTLAAGALALAACMDATGVPPAPGGSVPLGIAPRFNHGVGMNARAVDRVRVSVTEEGSDTPRGSLLEALDPDAPAWSLTVRVERPQTPAIRLVIAIELLHTDGATEVVEWSGRSAPIQLGLDQTLESAVVDLFPGPLANLGVESLAIVAPEGPVTEGDTVRLAFDVRGGGSGVRVILVSLDPDVAGVEADGAIVARTGGSARLVAQAGPRSDTLLLAVGHWPLAEAGPVTAFLPAAADAEQRLVASLADRGRGAPIAAALAELVARLGERRGALAAEALRAASAAVAAYASAA
ncbi:MAG TPA: hypothetical protein VMK65_05325, partial [Longimicrobiales bacterium]|nr:hypothetical protein [Longimicrobiales bacterium]